MRLHSHPIALCYTSRTTLTKHIFFNAWIHTPRFSCIFPSIYHPFYITKWRKEKQQRTHKLRVAPCCGVSSIQTRDSHSTREVRHRASSFSIAMPRVIYITQSKRNFHSSFPPRSASIQSEAQQLRRGVVETVGSRTHGAFQKMVIKTDCRPAEYSVIKRLAQRVEVLIQKRHTNLYLLKHRKEFDNISCCWCVMWFCCSSYWQNKNKLFVGCKFPTGIKHHSQVDFWLCKIQWNCNWKDI